MIQPKSIEPQRSKRLKILKGTSESTTTLETQVTQENQVDLELRL